MNTQLNPAEQTHADGHFTKRIGNTTFRVNVHFNDTSRETINDKILRLIKNEAISRKVVGQ